MAAQLLAPWASGGDSGSGSDSAEKVHDRSRCRRAAPLALVSLPLVALALLALPPCRLRWPWSPCRRAVPAAGRLGLSAAGRPRLAPGGPATLVVHGPSRYEFGWEVSVMVPNAYALVSAGLMNATRSCGDLSALYWFSPMHENIPCSRTKKTWKQWYGIQRDVLMSDVPDKDIPNWLPPRHKDHYSKFPALPGLFQAGVKKSVMVANKFTHEWGHAPINYFSEKLLDWMITSIRKKCPDTQMVYERNRILNLAKGHSYEAASDGNHELSSLHDFELLTGQERVVMMPDVVNKSSNLSFNEVQMRAMAKHTCFATVQGGLMAFVAQFGGKHIVLHRQGSETEAFYERLSRMGKGQIFVVRPKHSDNGEDMFKEAFEREILRDSCKACGILA